MPNLKPPLPTHLCIFVTDPETGRPVQRLPLYAEVAVPRIVPLPPINERFRQPVRAALMKIDPKAIIDPAVGDRVERAALQAFAETIDDTSQAKLLSQSDEPTRKLFEQAFNEVLKSTGRATMAGLSAAELKPLIAAAIRKVALQMELAVTAEVEETGVIWADPLGVLTTDHVGYVSFDLRRLRPDVQVLLGEAIEARRNDPDAVSKLAIWIYPHGHSGRFDALSQARFASDAVVARLSMTWNTLPPALINMGPRALQNPSLTDWRLSPASFAASPKTLVGENGCEEMVPANLALQEFVLRQVVRLTDVPANFGVPAGFKAAYVDEYKVSWFSLGHSLGEILYSLPLAPGETVKLAVIDWSWDSLTKRDEATKLTEEVLHQTHRDRTITETVKAGLKELQHGSSFMAGKAHSGGASGGANLGVVGLGAAAGDTWSLGGSTATSDGSRDLAAENVQRLSDSFSQASSSQRELNSTVVIQARQEEKESIQTRTFSNYNHSHTLTVLYYEVLRHYRVTVEWVRRRPAVLVKMPTRLTVLDDPLLVKHRFLLEPFLLDPTIKAGFDALEKRDSIAHYQTVQGINPAAPVPALWWEGNAELELFEIGIWTNDDTINNITVYVITAEDHARSKKNELHYVYKGSSGAGPNYDAHNINSGQRMETDQEQFTFLKLQGQEINGESKRIPWFKVIGFQFEKWGGTEWRIDALSIRAWDRVGFVVDFTPGKVDVNMFILGREPGSQCFSGIKRPGPPPPTPAPVLSPDKSLSAEEAYQLKRLRDHVAAHIDHYASVIQLGTNETQIARQFEAVPWAPGTMDDHVDPTPLDIFGSYVAYPLAKRLTGVDDTVVVDIAAALNGNDPARRQWAAERLAAMSDADRQSVLERLPLASAKSERLNTMATRGVFAEGKLGHCNLSEEIDETRFWKWEEHPIPIEAPGINPVTPIQPQPQQVSVTPTAFPQSLVNIVNPSPAPDPTGLTAALTLLGTPNIFRDMSGRQEVADLLKKLSDNSISIAEAANRAREIQAKYGTDLDKQQKELDLGVTKAAADVEGKTVEAEGRRAEAQASKAEADAKKSNIEAGVQQAESAKHLPKPMREPVQQAAANTLAGNPIKDKVIVFKAIGYNGQTLEGWFGLGVRDVRGQQMVIDEPKVAAYFDRPVTFKSPEPVIEARASRKETVPIKIMDEIVTLPGIDAVSPKDSYTVGKSHNIINVTLSQASRDVQFKATSTNTAVDELMNKWGAELGVNKTVAAKLVAEYEKKHSITHATAEEKSYTFNVPTQNYELKITSKV